jgi:hypothetical protein
VTPEQSVPITTKIVSSNPVHGEVYSMQNYMIKFFSDLRQDGCFLWVLRFPPPIRLTATIQLKYLTHLPLPCRDNMNMSVWGDVLLIIHVTLSDGSSTLNVVRLGLILFGLILNMSGRSCIIGGYNDNNHMTNTLLVGYL